MAFGNLFQSYLKSENKTRKQAKLQNFTKHSVEYGEVFHYMFLLLGTYQAFEVRSRGGFLITFRSHIVVLHIFSGPFHEKTMNPISLNTTKFTDV